jgi:hypothetical protein
MESYKMQYDKSLQKHQLRFHHFEAFFGNLRSFINPIDIFAIAHHIQRASLNRESGQIVKAFTRIRNLLDMYAQPVAYSIAFLIVKAPSNAVFPFHLDTKFAREYPTHSFCLSKPI